MRERERERERDREKERERERERERESWIEKQSAGPLSARRGAWRGETRQCGWMMGWE